MAYEGKPYQLLKKDRIACAGITPSRSADTGSMWLPYASVADVIIGFQTPFFLPQGALAPRIRPSMRGVGL